MKVHLTLEGRWNFYFEKNALRSFASAELHQLLISIMERFKTMKSYTVLHCNKKDCLFGM